MSIFQNANNIVINGGNFIAQSTVNDAIGPALQLLISKTAPGALHNSAERFDPPKCHPDTCQAIIQRIMDWLDDPQKTSYFIWLCGPAGVGKTSIAQSIADLCAEKDGLAASFFFGRNIARRNIKDFLIATIAYQMMMHLPEIRDKVLRAIERDPTVFDRSLEAQVQKLIIQPLNETIKDPTQGLSLKSRPVGLVVVDGLDECDLPESQTYILQTLSQLVLKLSIRMSFLISSRPEEAIRNAFLDDTLAPRTVVINLSGFSYNNYEDIRTFLDSKFQSIKHKHPARSSFPKPWPAESAMYRLLDITNGHFIYASTVMRYVESSQANPVQRLTRILEQNVPESDAPFVALDALYRQILSRVTDVKNLLKILAMILLLGGHPQLLKTAFMEESLSFEPGTVRILLNDLHSIVYVPDSEREFFDTFRFHHASFADFLCDPARSSEYFLDTETSRFTVAIALIRGNFASDFFFILPGFFNYYNEMDPDLKMKVHEELYLLEFDKLANGVDIWSSPQTAAFAQFVLWLDGKKIPNQPQDLFTFYLRSIVKWIPLSLTRHLRLPRECGPQIIAILQHFTSTVSSLQTQRLDNHWSEIDDVHRAKAYCISILRPLSELHELRPASGKFDMPDQECYTHMLLQIQKSLGIVLVH